MEGLVLQEIVELTMQKENTYISVMLTIIFFPMD